MLDAKVEAKNLRERAPRQGQDMDGEMDKKKTQVAKKVPEKLQYGKTMENSNSKILSTILGVYRIFRHPDSSGAVRKVDWKTSTLPGYLQYLESKTVHHWLVVEPTPSEKYEFVSWDHYSQYMEK